MKNYKKYSRLILMVFFVLSMVFQLRGNETEKTNYSLDKEKWEKTTKRASYNERPRKEKKPQDRKERSWQWPEFFSLLAQNWKFIVYPLIILILACILYRMLRGSMGYRRERVRKKVKYSIEELEKHIHEADLDAILKDAIAAKDFKLAVRLHYLIIIKHLSDLQLITLKKEKTNGDYLSDMKDHKSFPGFFQLTCTYENIWYGDKTINEKIYSSVRQNFTEFTPIAKTHEP